ncbi:receptor-like protein 43 [Eucalyptus grandis]|uniref:receptor-like protein 43 n=1 Tax=Eucalyptus grandis TaxID=71139 RepID=UPI00192EF6B3|nr:receptor-like protein 43 [Eucalyptus grandis]
MKKESLHFSYMILLLTIVASHSLASTQPRCHEDERSALLEFKTTFFTRKRPCCHIKYTETPVEQAKVESWNASEGKTQSDCCSWTGVECDKVSGHVIGLDLSCSCLSGKINSNTNIFRLLRLRSLNLAFNDFNCPIPLTIGNLSSLRDLNLSSSSFTGHISHSLRNLTRLVHLDLSDNHLNGTIPTYFGSILNLEHLDLGFNSLTGEVPSSLGNLVQLTTLHLVSNQLTGKIPSSLGNLVQLTTLHLGYNQLTGEIPSSIGDLIQLTDLALYFNRLVGEIPLSFQNLLELNFLDLGFNRLSGEIPSLLGRLTQLVDIDLSFNQFHGAIPSTISQLQGLNSLNLHSNNLSGTVKLDMLSEAKNLQQLVLSSNKLSLIVETNITHQYSVLVLGSCNLNSFPEFLQDQNDLYLLDLSDNNISGQVPKWFLNVSTENLELLNLSGNFLTSFTQDPVIFKWKNLLEADLDLSQNSFSGSLPSKYFKHWTAMKVPKTDSSSYMGDELGRWWLALPFWTFDYSMSVFAKGIEMNYSKIQGYLTLIDLSSNNFSGAIPETIGSLKQLKLLNLSNNMLSGPLPPFLANLTNLEALDLSRNQLSGEISQDLTQLTSLEVFDVSYNCLIGPIPKSRQFATFENNSYKGNSGLCGAPLSKKCGYPEASPPSFPTSEEDQDSGSAMELDWKIVCMGYASGLVIGVVLGNCLIT